MSLPSDRVMPSVVARYSEIRRAWLVQLPGGSELSVPQAADVQPLVDRHCPGTAIRFVRGDAHPFPRPHTAAKAGRA